MEDIFGSPHFLSLLDMFFLDMLTDPMVFGNYRWQTNKD